MDSVQANEGDSGEVDYDPDILMPDCSSGSRVKSEMLEAEESSKNWGETCFGTVSKLHWQERLREERAIVLLLTLNLDFRCQSCLVE